MAAPRDDFGSVRPIRRLNRLTQALLAIALAVVVNFLASLPEFRLRHDITADRRHSLAPESAETVRAAGQVTPGDGGACGGQVLGLQERGKPRVGRVEHLLHLLAIRRHEARARSPAAGSVWASVATRATVPDGVGLTAPPLTSRPHCDAPRFARACPT